VVALRHVESISDTIASGSAQRLHTLTTTLNSTAASFQLFSRRLTGGNQPQFGTAFGRVNSTSQVEFKRTGTTGAPTMTIEGWVVEFTSGVSVIRGTADMASATSASLTHTIDKASSFIMLTGSEQGGGGYGDDDFHGAFITSDTSQSIVRVNGPSGTCNVPYQIVTGDTFSVQHPAAVSFASTDASKTVTLGSSIDKTKTFIIGSYSCESGTVTRIGQKLFTWRFSDANNTDIIITRDDGTSAAATVYVQAVTVSDATVRAFDLSFTSSETTPATPATITAVNTSNSIIILGGLHQCGGRCAYTGDDDISVGYCTTALASSTTVTATRGATGSTAATINGWVIDFSSSSVTLTVQGAGHGHTADNVSLTQQNTLAVQAADHAHTADNIALTQQNTLAVADTLHSHAAGNIDLLQANTLNISGALHAHSADNLDLVQANILAVAGTIHTHNADSIALVQQNTLSINGALHDHTAGNIDLIQANTLVVADALHVHSVENLVLTQQNTLAVQEAIHAHGAQNIDLIQANIIVVQDTLHAHSADNITLNTGETLIMQDALHAHTADTIALIQQNTLAVQDALHAHTAGNVDLLQQNTIVVQDALHAHSVENITLDQSSVLVIQATLHDHTSGNIDLLQQNTLIVQSALHLHSAELLQLIQQNTLSIQDALHAHSVESPELSTELSLILADTLHGHTVQNVLLVQQNVLSVQQALHVHHADGITLLLPGQDLVIYDFPSRNLLVSRPYSFLLRAKRLKRLRGF